MFDQLIKVDNYDVVEIDYQQPELVFDNFAGFYGSVLLTGRGDKTNSQYSFIGTRPNLDMKFIDDEISINNLKIDKNDVWSFLKTLLQKSQFHDLKYPANLCGFIGYFSYEMCRKIENIPKTTKDSYKIPMFQLLAYKTYFVFDNFKKKAWKIDVKYEDEIADVNSNDQFKFYSISNLVAESTKPDYLQKVKSVQKYIRNGDVYEVNLTQQISGDFEGSAYQLFQKIYTVNDAPYSCYFNLDNFQIVSNSPEMFLRANNKEVETRPIKGTIKRDTVHLRDLNNRELLLHSQKDQAELFMIIDLLRNDLGKVSEIGSVFVKEAKTLEVFQNVYHLVGIIKSKLQNDKDYIDLLKATFPGGSITGCPKLRSMEIIDELETFTRNLYTGTILIMNQQYLNSSIVIRTAMIKDGKIIINSGGAITIDSEPLEEYNEMEAKIINIMEVLRGER